MPDNLSRSCRTPFSDLCISIIFVLNRQNWRSSPIPHWEEYLPFPQCSIHKDIWTVRFISCQYAALNLIWQLFISRTLWHIYDVPRTIICYNAYYVQTARLCWVVLLFPDNGFHGCCVSARNGYRLFIEIDRQDFYFVALVINCYRYIKSTSTNLSLKKSMSIWRQTTSWLQSSLRK